MTRRRLSLLTMMMMLAAPVGVDAVEETVLTQRNGHVVLGNGCEELQLTFYNNNLVTAEEIGCLYAGGSGAYTAVGQFVTPQPVLYTLEATGKQGANTSLVPGGSQSSSQYLLYYTVDSSVVHDRIQQPDDDPAIQPPVPQPEDQQYLLILSEQTSQYQRYVFSERGPQLEDQGTWSYCQRTGRDGMCMDAGVMPLTSEQ